MLHANPRKLRRSLITALLFLLALAVRILRACRQQSVNQDAIRFIDQAKRLRLDLLGALRAEVYHPLHSLMALAVHQLIQPWFSNDRMAWIAAVQCVGILCGAIVAVQIVALARALGAPFWAALAAALVWSLGRRTSGYGAEGISDMLFLALFSAAMLLGIRALAFRRRDRAPRRLLPFALAGFLGGLAYLTRPEGIAVPIILSLSLLLLSVHGINSPRRRWKLLGRFTVSPHALLLPLLSLLAGFLLTASPYMLIIGGITRKKNLLSLASLHAHAAMVRIPIDTSPGITLTSLANVGLELWDTFGFAPTILVVGAMLFAPYFWGRRRVRPLVIIWTALWIAVMLWLIQKAGYLDGRHTLPLQLILHVWLAFAFLFWMKPMRWWMNWWRRKPIWPRLPAWMRSHRWPAVMAAGAVLFSLLPAALPGLASFASSQPDEQVVTRQAALWIARHTSPNTIICDHQQLAGYYSNHPYFQWLGTPANPLLHSLPPTDPQHPLILGYLFHPHLGEQPVSSIGPYHAIATFQPSDPPDANIYILYALPNDNPTPF